VLAPPDDLPERTLTAALGGSWRLGVASIEYRAVGFGSHHWLVADTDGTRWFVTVDDLEMKRHTAGEPLDVPYARLARALDAARALDLPFVVAPSAPLLRLTERYAAALYPYVEGESFEWGDYPEEAHRVAVQEMLAAVHRDSRRLAAADDLQVPHRDALQAALAGEPVAECGPYAAPAARLISDHAGPIGALLSRYDELAAGADRSRAVLTHGEPHPGNTMRTTSGWKLIDWDTALLAPPERDLWLIGGDHAAYTEATGVAVLPEILELYRLRWAVADLGVEVDRFRRPHNGDADDEESWRLLRGLVERGLT
jgi:spectinomycin phosphotransferase/16S rRNA (guanine(1405)-N(7))-methyltransferase